MRRTAVNLVAAMLFAAAPPCLSGGDDPLATRWQVATLGGAPAEPGGDITFEGEDVSGATACNLFGGSFARSGTDGLTITLGRMTRRGCGGVAAERERALIEAFSATRSYGIDGKTLTLKDAGGIAVATFIEVGNASLEGPRHKIVSFLLDGGLHSVVSGSGAAIAFKDGRITGATGCRAFSGYYRFRDGKLEIDEVTITEKTVDPCPEELKDQDEGIMAALPLARGFDATRNLVRLLEEQGSAVLWITPDEG